MRKCLFIWLLLPMLATGQRVSKDNLEIILDKTLNYLQASQEKETIGDSIFKGEWPSTMGLKNSYLLLGKSVPYRDSNCFTQAAIFNLLAELYLADNSRVQIKDMLRLSYPELLTYKDGVTFNFWKQLEPNRDLDRRNTPIEGYLAHRPTNYKLKSRFINNAADIANDADDTAAGYKASFFYKKIFGEEASLLPHLYFDSFLDQNRNNYHWYNYIHKIPCPSNAYMTWFADEYQWKKWSFAKQVVHNCFFYFRWSSCYPHPYERYVPWGANDVDAVVNANILNYLGWTDQIEAAKGKDGAISLFDNALKRERWSRAGIYYPNRYYFHYVLSEINPFIWDEGLDLTPLLEHLKLSQKEDGSYHSRWKVNKKDKLQSTVYAWIALMNYKAAGFDISQKQIDDALYYILENGRFENNQVSWKGGVFFSGGTVVRNTLYFKSDAFTTALVARGIQKYLNL